MEANIALTGLISSTTKSTQQKPDQQLYEDIAKLISSRADLPKHAINCLIDRLKEKNDQVDMLVFDLLEYLTLACGVTFQNTISEKNFLIRMGTYLNQQNREPILKKRLAATIYIMAQNLDQGQHKMFFDFYKKCQDKNIEFPSSYNSPYQSISKVQYTQSKPVEPKQPQQSLRQPCQSPPDIRKPDFSNKTPFEKLKAELNFVNELIDKVDYRNDITKNSYLINEYQNIMASQSKLQELIQNCSNEKQMNALLITNEDMLLTKKRMQQLKKGQKPDSFKEDVDAETLRQIQELELAEKQQKGQQQFFESQNFKEVVPPPVPQQPPQAQQLNLLDDFPVAPVQPVQQSPQQVFPVQNQMPTLPVQNQMPQSFPVQNQAPQNFPVQWQMPLNCPDQNQMPKQPIQQNNQGDIFDLLGPPQQVQQQQPQFQSSPLQSQPMSQPKQPNVDLDNLFNLDSNPQPVSDKKQQQFSMF